MVILLNFNITYLYDDDDIGQIIWWFFLNNWTLSYVNNVVCDIYKISVFIIGDRA